MARFIPKPKQINLAPATHYPPSLAKQRTIWGSDAAIRKEYRRLQAAVDKRLKRAEASGFGKTALAREMRSIKRISKINDMGKVSTLLNKAYRILRDQRYTLEGIRKSASTRLEKLKSKGFILPEDSRGREPSQASVDALFAAAKRRGYLGDYGSDKVYEIYREYQEKGDAELNEEQWDAILQMHEKMDAWEV